jgi:polar amino acid transport system substrate-binding protein
MNAKRFLLCLLLVLSGIVGAEPTVLRFAYEDKELFPFFAGDSAEVPAKPGVTVEMVQRLTSRIPAMKVELQRMPWKRCLLKLEKGEVDAVVASFTSDRLAYGLYPMKDGQTNPALRIGSTSYALYKRKDAALEWDGKSLKGLVLAMGAPSGYSIVEELRAMGLTVEESGSTGADLQKLQMGRLGAVAAVETVADFYLTQSRFGEITKMEPAFAPKHYYLLLSHQFFSQSPALADKVWQAIGGIRERESSAILGKYLK